MKHLTLLAALLAPALARAHEVTAPGVLDARDWLDPLNPDRALFGTIKAYEDLDYLGTLHLGTLAATDALRPDTRDKSGADAVLRSTPTEFTQSSTTASSARASAPVLPAPAIHAGCPSLVKSPYRPASILLPANDPCSACPCGSHTAPDPCGHTVRKHPYLL